MRRHAKASSAAPAGTRISRIGVAPGRAMFALTSLLAFLALPGAAQAACPNEEFRQGISSILPDCRAYEQVSPRQKNNSDVVSGTGSQRSAWNGNRMVFSSVGGFSNAQSLYGVGQFLGTRTTTGWTSRGMAPAAPKSFSGGPAPVFFSVGQDLEHAVVRSSNMPAAPGAEPNSVNLYRRDPDGSFELVTPPGPTGLGINNYVLNFASASADYSHILFESNEALTPDAPPPTEVGGCPPSTLYESVNGVIRVVGILPNGSVAPASKLGPGPNNFPNHCGGVNSFSYFQDEFAISQDGSRIFWTDPSTNQLYLRINGTETVHVSASQRTIPDPDGGQAARFLQATPDGSKVFFLSGDKLTDSEPAESLGPYLYVYDVASEDLTDLSIPAAGQEARALGVSGISEDGSFVYFAASAALTPEAAEGVPTGNLYLWHNGALTFIATLDQSRPSEPKIWTPDAFLTGGGKKVARVTPDGQTLQFLSYENLGDPGEKCEAPELARVFLYSALDDSLKCISRRSDGGPQTHEAALDSSQGFGALIEPMLTRTLSDDGSRAFFETAEPLVPEDTNGKTDVYMWDGQVHLISTGRGGENAHFSDASASGGDVFFTTREQLLRSDRDSNVDMYDARVNGGFPDPPPPPPGCEGDACQSPPVPPNDPTPASASFNGKGSEKPALKKKRQRKARSKHQSRKHKGRGAKSRHAKANSTHRIGG